MENFRFVKWRMGDKQESGNEFGRLSNPAGLNLAMQPSERGQGIPGKMGFGFWQKGQQPNQSKFCKMNKIYLGFGNSRTVYWIRHKSSSSGRRQASQQKIISVSSPGLRLNSSSVGNSRQHLEHFFRVIVHLPYFWSESVFQSQRFLCASVTSAIF